MKRFIQFLEEAYGQTLGIFESVEARQRGQANLLESQKAQDNEKKKNDDKGVLVYG